MPADDETFRRQIAEALAREPSHADLQADLAVRLTRWLRTPVDRPSETRPVQQTEPPVAASVEKEEGRREGRDVREGQGGEAAAG